MDRMRNIVLLGATGSIGESTLQVLRGHRDRLRLVGVGARGSSEKLAEVVREFGVPHAALTDRGTADAAVRQGTFPPGCELHAGEESLSTLACLPEADVVLVAVVGTTALRPTLEAIRAGKDIALASKEILVLGGAYVMEAARSAGVRLLPTDSEHNAIFQCMEGNPGHFVDGLVLTASGGRFRDRDPATLGSVTPEEAVDHPNWSMGPKITVDSATMANKGLELIEAHWLFGLPAERLEVVLHRQSIVHSLVRFVDGSILGQLSPPSMTFAIQHCLLYPERAPGVEKTLDFREAFALDFAPVPSGRYPCLDLAFEALRSGPAAMAVFNAANEIAVAAFLEGRIPFPGIPSAIRATLDACGNRTTDSLGDLLALDAEVRRRTTEAL